MDRESHDGKRIGDGSPNGRIIFQLFRARLSFDRTVSIGEIALIDCKARRCATVKAAEKSVLAKVAEESRWLRLRAAVAIFRISGDGEIPRKIVGELTDDPEPWSKEIASRLLAGR